MRFRLSIEQNQFKAIALLLILICLGLSSNAQENSSKAYWKNGFRFESADGKYKLKFGGAMQTDYAFFNLDDDLTANFGELNSGVEFRRIRMATSGTLYGNVKFKMQMEFAGGSASLKDLYMEVREIPLVGNFRVGQFNEPFSLEAITSNKYTKFLERSYAEIFSPERNTGIMIHDSYLEDRLTLAFGAFRNADKFGADLTAGDGYTLTTRLTGLPVYKKEEGEFKMLHIGLAYRKHAPSDRNYSAKTRNESHLSHKYLNTGTIGNVHFVRTYHAELAAVWNSFYFQTEANLTNLHRTKSSLTNHSFSNFYAYAGYFFTGEHRNYKKSAAIFDRVSPKKNFNLKEKGWGAWELAVRYGQADLTHENIKGGEETDVTLGLNWHLNPNMRIHNNYIFTDVRGKGKGKLYQVRFQLDF